MKISLVLVLCWVNVMVGDAAIENGTLILNPRVGKVKSSYTREDNEGSRESIIKSFDLQASFGGTYLSSFPWE